MNTRITQGTETVVFPTGKTISPGFQHFHTKRIDIHEMWVWGEIVDTKEEVVELIHGVDVPDPGFVDDDDVPSLRGSFSFLDKTWMVVRDDDEEFWGLESTCHPIKEMRTVFKTFIKEDGTREVQSHEAEIEIANPDDPRCRRWKFFTGGKAAWLARIDEKNRAFLEAGASAGWWDIGPDGNPQKPAIKVSIAAMAAEHKTLMAHLMVDLGLFPSVGQAKKNGWDRPLELGRHELGPKKKRAFVEIIP